MVFKAPNCREEIGDPMDKYSVNHDISTLFRKSGKKLRHLLREGSIVSWI